MSKKLKKNLKRILISLGCFLVLMIFDKVLEIIDVNKYPNGIASLIPNQTFGWLLPFVLFLIIYIYIGNDVVKKSFKNILNGQVFDENFLMTVATLGAFGLGIYTGITTKKPVGFDEACAVILFYHIGEWFQSYAVGKSRKQVASLMDIRPDFARIKNGNGDFEEVDPSTVIVGDVIYVYPGEKIALDGVVINGDTTLDTKALTGESMPREVNLGDSVISGSINLTKSIEVKVTKVFGESTVSKILDLVENASNHKSKSETFINKFAKYYTPIVVYLALALAFIPPVITLIVTKDVVFGTWIYRALSFLVVSCPCALVISIPLTFFAGIGGASKNGILVKGSIHLERFNKASIFVFDKTGTLTKGNFKVQKVYPENLKNNILKYASIAEEESNHPIAIAIKNEFNYEKENLYTLENIAGKGILAKGQNTILCGNEKLMELYNIEYVKSNEIGTTVYVAVDNKFLGYIVIVDEIKDEAKSLINFLNKKKHTSYMLTGDNEQIASHVASTLGVSKYYASLLPQDKVTIVKDILNNKKDDELVCFIGDGINDAPVLMISDIGIAMGGVGSDAAIEASDIVLMNDNLNGIVKAKKLASKTMQIVMQNIVFAIGIKVLILILTAIGISNMWFAVFGDVGVAVLAILNAMRANKKL